MPVLVAGDSASVTRSGSNLPFEADLLLGRVRSGHGNHRWANVEGGVVAGGAVQGRVQSGRVDWLVDPMSGAFSVALVCEVGSADGAVSELRSSAVEVGAADFNRGRVLLRAANQG